MCELVNSENEDKNEGTLSTIETERRDNAMAKRNRKQETQAIKAMKQCGRAAQAGIIFRSPQKQLELEQAYFPFLLMLMGHISPCPNQDE